jgi:hypothetical protein
VDKLAEEAANDTVAWCAETTTSSHASYRGLVEKHSEAMAASARSVEAPNEVLESDEEPEGPVATIEVKTVESWKRAYCDWVWTADPTDEHPEKLFGWLNVWRGDEGDKVAATLRKTADAARIGLAGKRSEFRDANDVVIVAQKSGAVGASMEMQRQLEAHGSHCRASFVAWMDMQLNEQLGTLLQRREADLAGGTAEVPKDAVLHTVADVKDVGFTKVGGSRRKAGGKDSDKSTAADLGEKKKVINGMLKGAGAPVAKKT